MSFRDRVIELRRVRAGDLIPNPRNWRGHPKAQRDALQSVLEEVGIADVVIIRDTPAGPMLIDGHLRSDLDPDAILPAIVTDLDDDEADIVLATLDPLAAMARTEADELKALYEGLRDDGARSLVSQLHTDDRELVQFFASTEAKDPVDVPTPDPPANPISRPGDLWFLGPHRLLCGDSTKAEDVGRLFDGGRGDVMVTDPPYCSGGFQEAGRSAGSVGTRGEEMVANDTLSTRGYIALMKSVIGHAPVGIAYIFTDWRMWINLFDVAESSGFGVRNMIVWDKGTPGMGVGWRMQHELILCAIKVKAPFDPKKAQGNVIACQRTGNKLHATEKPVELVAKILDVTDMARIVYDPFAGSGTTMIAAEQMRRQCFSIEIDPRYVDVAVQRWEETTGGKAVRK